MAQDTVLGSGFSGNVFLATSRRQRSGRFAVKSIKLHSKETRRTSNQNGESQGKPAGGGVVPFEKKRGEVSCRKCPLSIFKS